MSAEVLYPVSEVAQMWRCSRVHVYDLIKRGRLRTVNLGTGRSKTRIPESALAAYVRTHGVTEPPAGPSTPPPPPRPPRRSERM